MERTLLFGVNLLRSDGDARFAWFPIYHTALIRFT